MTPRPRLLILSFSPIFSDARVLKQVRHFAEHYDVTTCGYGGNPGSGVTHLQIDDDKPYYQHSRRDLILRRHRASYWAVPAVVAAQQLLAAEQPFDIVIANDIDTVGLAVSLGARLGVHADIHEYAPKQNEELFMWRLFIAPYVRWMCRTFLPRVDSMTTVGWGIAEEYKRVFGLDAGVVTNAAPYAELAPLPVADPIRLVHSGAALRNRRIDVLVEAALMARTPVTLDLYLMPNDPEYIAELRDRASSSTTVTIHDPLPYAELVEALNAYDVGLPVIPPANFSYEWSLPNKFFDYVQARLGVIIGPSPEMRTTLDQYGLGVTATGFGAVEIAAAIDELTPAAVTAWKANADASAHALSAENQTVVWDAAIAAIAAKAGRG